MAGKPEEELSDEAEVSEGESNVCLGGSRQSRWAINVTELLMQMLQEVPLVSLCYEYSGDPQVTLDAPGPEKQRTTGTISFWARPANTRPG